MNLYIDRENVYSLIANTKHQLYGDCLRTMQKHLNVFFNFKKTDLANDEILLAWFKSFTEGVGKCSKQVFNEEIFPARPIKPDSHNIMDREQLSSIYLISDDRMGLLKDKGTVLIGSPGEEFDVFNQIFLYNEDYKFEKKFKIGSTYFNKWADIERYSSCVTDILFIDNFILSDPSLIDANFISFLRILVSKSKYPIRIVLLVNTDRVSLSFEDIRLKIRSEIEQVTGCKPFFTLVKVRDQRGVKSLAEHDRTICTNYLRIYSGDSFNYFKTNGEVITKGREIHISSLGDYENHALSNDLISDIQRKIDELPESAIEGDKKSNFLTFK
jgi:hypothetical protein